MEKYVQLSNKALHSIKRSNVALSPETRYPKDGRNACVGVLEGSTGSR